MNRCLASAVPQEILLRIFALCNQGDNARNARVCRAWKEAALDQVWRILEEWTQPLYMKQDSTIARWAQDGVTKDFARNLTEEDWLPLVANSSRVRHIECFETYAPLTESAMLEIASTRPLIRLFPNLSSLHACMDSPEFNPMIMHDSILDLCLILPDHETDLDHHLRRIEERMPNVTSLEICLAEIQPLSTTFCEDPLEHFFSQLKLNRLRKVTLPLYWLTPSLASHLSTCRGLREIAINTQQSWNQHGVPTDTQPFQPSLQEGAFACLEHLSFACTLPCASRFIADPHFPASAIKSLWLRVSSIDEETPVQLSSFLDTLAHSCHSLERLEIVITPLRDWPKQTDPNEFTPIGFCHLLPILRLRNMKAFAIRHIRDLDVNDDQARSIAMHWPGIEELTLNPHPALDSESSRILTIRSLIHFAQHCPRLRSLSLSVKICQDSLLEPPSFDAPFKSLCLLNVGYSEHPSDYHEKLCRFLGRLLPAHCKIDTHATQDFNNFHDREALDQPEWGWRDEEEGVEAGLFWGNVETTLSLMNEFRQQGRREQIVCT